MQGSPGFRTGQQQDRRAQQFGMYDGSASAPNNHERTGGQYGALADARFADAGSQRANPDSRLYSNRSEQASDRPSGNFGTGTFGRNRNQEGRDRPPFQYGQEEGSGRSWQGGNSGLQGSDPRISFGNQHY